MMRIRTGFLVLLCVASFALILGACSSPTPTATPVPPTAAPSATAPATAVATVAPNFGLSDADAKLVSDAFSSFKAKSFQMDYTLKVNGTGLPNGDINLDLSGSGPFAYDPARMQAASSDLQGALSSLMLAQVINADLKSGTVDQKNTLELRVVDAALYFMGDVVTQGKWMKLNLVDAVKSLQTNNPFSSVLGGASSSSPATSAATQAGPGAARTTLAHLLKDPDVQASLGKLPAIPGFIVAKRAADQTVDGVSVATMTVTADFTKLLASPDIKPLVKAALTLQTQQAGSTAPVTDDQVNVYIDISKSILKQGTLTLTALIGTNDKVLRGLGFNLNASADTTLLNTGSAGPANLTIDFLVKLSKLDQPVKVEAVASATEFKMPSIVATTSAASAATSAPVMAATSAATSAR